ncbi:hypothetical protein [Rhodanobacter sp. MP1X3]|jgi:hypothetical protein|uniref:hypothetical protein n=1 Tax=Rhodanobacter sp. MP1X3 TaxID=2723086 RepID=UPI001611DCDB|nr:hypothetical protein [Rhodanobacter sp. MP1X3]MBB6242594.1 hypothetical protein [Rhodanobacter sp. MP1X3]
MRVKHWLIGCAICFAGIGGAAATTADSHDLDNALHGAGDTSSAHDGSSGIEPGVARDNTPRNTGSDSRKGSYNGTDHASGDITPPAHTQQTHLGWQSLLPGSIQ